MSPFELMQLPLSAYTPGQGDQSMEGGWETATGAPVYTYEMFLQGQAPYVTGATSMKKPSGATVYRNIGGQQVPVKITDYGPGVKGLDIASQNKSWATNFPYQGQTDKFKLADDRTDLMNQVDQSIYGTQPTPTPTPTPQRLAAAGQMGTWNDYAHALAPTTTEQAASAIGAGLRKAGQGMQQQGQQGMQQALSMLQQRSPQAQALLAQFANNPMMYLAPLNL